MKMDENFKELLEQYGLTVEGLTNTLTRLQFEDQITIHEYDVFLRCMEVAGGM
jgi:hypothetical protein